MLSSKPLQSQWLKTAVSYSHSYAYWLGGTYLDCLWQGSASNSRLGSGLLHMILMLQLMKGTGTNKVLEK